MKSDVKLKPDVIAEMRFENDRLKRSFELGPLVKTRNLEDEKIDDFNKVKNNIALNALTMFGIGRNESRKAAEEVMDALFWIQGEIIKMKSKAKKINADVEIITLGLKEVMSGKKISVNELKLHANAVIPQITLLEKKNKNIKSGIDDLKNFIQMPFDEKTEVKDAIEYYEMIVKGYDKQRIRNINLEEMVRKFTKVVDGAISEWEVKLDLIEEVKDIEKHRFSQEVVDFIMTKIVAKRDIAAFYNMCGEASAIKTLKERMERFQTTVYATEKNLFLCKEAEKNGIDFVGKGGINAMDGDCFDITFNFINQFEFERKDVGNSGVRLSKEEEIQLVYPMNQKISKVGSVVIFNLPHYLFRGKALNWIDQYYQFSIEDCYRVDDPLKNVLIVAKFVRGNKNDQRQVYDAIRFDYDSLSHYTEMKEIVITDGKLTLPEVFVPVIREAEDFEAAFPEEMGDAIVNDINMKYTPEEKVVAMNPPLQELSDGHKTAVACSEYVNNIYDGKGNDAETILYSAKIVRQQLEEVVEESKNGETKKFLLLKNKNIIVSKKMRPNGEIHTLIETK